MERDLTSECVEDLSRKKQERASVEELRQYFCGVCRNLGCSQIVTGPKDPMGERARRQVERLLSPTIVDPDLPKYQTLVRRSNFEDAREAAQAWDLRRPVPANFPDQLIDPSRLAGPRIPDKPPLRALPAQANAPLPAGAVTGALGSSRPVADPWDPASGGMRVRSGATIRLDSEGKIDPRR